jgi:hypothetical protein
MTRTPPSREAVSAHRFDLEALLRAQAARLDA